MTKTQASVSHATAVGSVAWYWYVSVVKDFFEKTKVDYHQDLVKLMLSNFQVLGARISTKVYYLFNHLVRFSEILADLGEEQGKRIHEDIKTMKETYQG